MVALAAAGSASAVTKQKTKSNQANERTAAEVVAPSGDCGNQSAGTGDKEKVLQVTPCPGMPTYDDVAFRETKHGDPHVNGDGVRTPSPLPKNTFVPKEAQPANTWKEGNVVAHDDRQKTAGPSKFDQAMRTKSTGAAHVAASSDQAIARGTGSTRVAANPHEAKAVEKSTSGLRDTMKTQVRAANLDETSPSGGKLTKADAGRTAAGTGSPDHAITTKGTGASKVGAAEESTADHAINSKGSGGNRAAAEAPGTAASVAANTLNTKHDTAKNAIGNLR